MKNENEKWLLLVPRLGEGGVRVYPFMAWGPDTLSPRGGGGTCKTFWNFLTSELIFLFDLTFSFSYILYLLPFTDLGCIHSSLCISQHLLKQNVMSHKWMTLFSFSAYNMRPTEGLPQSAKGQYSPGGTPGQFFQDCLFLDCESNGSGPRPWNPLVFLKMAQKVLGQPQI